MLDETQQDETRQQDIKVPKLWPKGAEWQNLLKFEAAGIRTAVAATVPFIVGQLLGYAAVGLMIGLGGLYVAITDKQGARLPAMLIATLGVAVSAFVGSLVGNNLWLSVGLIFLWAFLGGMAGIYGNVATNVGFGLTLSCAVMQGMPASFTGALDRAFECGAGGLWATALTLLLWHVAGHSPVVPTEVVPPLPIADPAKAATLPTTSGRLVQWWREFVANLTWRSVMFQHALRLAVVSAIAVALYKGLHIEHGYWLIITALVIVKPDLASTKQRAQERMLGSLVGGLLAVLLAATIRNVVALNVLLVLLAMLAFSHSPNNYGLYVVFLTPFVVLMINIADPGYWQIALVRIYDNLAGGVLALTVAYLLRPQAAAPPLASRQDDAVHELASLSEPGGLSPH